jgi:hypothetical protein
MDHWTVERMVKERQQVLLDEAARDRLLGGRPSLMSTVLRPAAAAGRLLQSLLVRRTGATFARMSGAGVSGATTKS